MRDVRTPGHASIRLDGARRLYVQAGRVLQPPPPSVASALQSDFGEVTKLDWERAKRRRPRGKRKTSELAEVRQIGMRDFVLRHGLTCFKCGRGEYSRQWAKTGLSDRGPWAICVTCIHKRQ